MKKGGWMRKVDRQWIDNYLFAQSLFIEEIGLMNGKMGIALYYFLLSDVYADQLYYEFASELLEGVYNSGKLAKDLTYDNGLPGIGIGMMYLMTHQHISAGEEEVFDEFDTVVHKFINLDPAPYRRRKELVSCGYYLVQRLQYEQFSGRQEVQFFLSENLILLSDEIEKVLHELTPVRENLEALCGIIIVQEKIFSIGLYKEMVSRNLVKAIQIGRKLMPALKGIDRVMLMQAMQRQRTGEDLKGLPGKVLAKNLQEAVVLKRHGVLNTSFQADVSKLCLANGLAGQGLMALLKQPRLEKKIYSLLLL
jgi:hypothetical protein